MHLTVVVIVVIVVVVVVSSIAASVHIGMHNGCASRFAFSIEQGRVEREVADDGRHNADGHASVDV